MNFLAIDFGYKRIGLAVSVMDVINPLPVIQNNSTTFDQIKDIVKEYSIDGIYVGVSEGQVATDSKIFAQKLSRMLKLPVETIEEAVSTIEAKNIYLENKNKKKDYKTSIDSIAAAVILRRAI
jgi:putative transcription antitermination factor YqgF